MLSLYTLFTKSGMASPSEYDLIDQPEHCQYTFIHAEVLELTGNVKGIRKL